MTRKYITLNKNWRTDFDWQDKNDHPVNYNEVPTPAIARKAFAVSVLKNNKNRIEKLIEQGKTYEEIVLPKMVSKYMQKKYNISDKLIELLLKEKNIGINYENKQKQIGQCMTSRRIANTPREALGGTQ